MGAKLRARIPWVGEAATASDHAESVAGAFHDETVVHDRKRGEGDSKKGVRGAMSSILPRLFRPGRILSALVIAVVLSFRLTTPAGAAVTASFDPATGTLSVFGGSLDNTITISRDAAGTILVNGGAVAVVGGTPTIANTTLIQVFGLGGHDTITLDESGGALPRSSLFGGSENDTLTGGSSSDQLFGGADNDTLTGGDADDQVFGESGDDRMIWNPGDDTDLNEGGDGTDTVEVNGGSATETFTVTANGARAIRPPRPRPLQHRHRHQRGSGAEHERRR
jgi:hypothetical protein